jgi:hypothetical protein
MEAAVECTWAEGEGAAFAWAVEEALLAFIQEVAVVRAWAGSSRLLVAQRLTSIARRPT